LLAIVDFVKGRQSRSAPVEQQGTELPASNIRRPRILEQGGQARRQHMRVQTKTPDFCSKHIRGMAGLMALSALCISSAGLAQDRYDNRGRDQDRGRN